MFSKVMFILKLYGSRWYFGINFLTPSCHFSDFLQYHCIVYRIMGIFPPGKGAMILTKHCRNRFIVFLSKVLRNEKTCITFISSIYLFFCQTSYAGNLSVHIVCMGRPVARNAASCLRPTGCPRRMGMNESTDIRKSLIQFQMNGCIWGRKV